MVPNIIIGHLEQFLFSSYCSKRLYFEIAVKFSFQEHAHPPRIQVEIEIDRDRDRDSDTSDSSGYGNDTDTEFRLLEMDNRLVLPFFIESQVLISRTDVLHS